MGTLVCEHGKVPSKGDECGICDAQVREGNKHRTYVFGQDIYRDKHARVLRAVLEREPTEYELQKLMTMVSTGLIRLEFLR